MKSIEIKAFVPAKDYELSKQFYVDFGFEMASDNNGIAYFKSGDSSFLLQDFYEEEHANNFMMHLLVEDAHACHTQLKNAGIASKYQVKMTEPVEQPWGMLDFVIIDPSGVLWRVGQNI
ncbi:VOC family protein [Marinomonas sp. C2222]|uniref:VOC family protein n=1 Tax=Marinomonas sargassi TaxID=2984494 RepID=A0ABT2YRI8_9GAMM|nr:VOC family protein [Marinomonas sargassi]MCV2402481.1 VOC family protein [Marinomonas sargassi]